MLTEERFKYILDKVKIKGTVKLKDLVSELDVSESTIRRDLDELEEKGLVKRVHGGAVGTQSNFTSDNTITERITQYSSEKKRIAKYCSDFIEDGDFIYLDSGTTTYELIPYLKDKNVIVVTNGVYNVERLLEYNVKTYILGGGIKEITKTVVGEQALKQIEDFRFNKAFIGANGVTFNAAITTPDISEAILKREAISRSEEAFVLVDSSKFGKVSFSKICDLEDVSIVTDADKDNMDEDILNATSVSLV
ncbi:MAG: DeoR/GlpR family DNA-binding transcription regulator [Peptostreptococcus sp.]|uniref:DeoR/GlpR family DNA-binding transcription regulator n=1 Tax=Peptostreptococcus sp. TaxID=1262 RepID=UPI002FC72178